MSPSIAEFWKLVIESRLLDAQQCHALGTEYSRLKGAQQQGNAKALAQWLISRNALTSYQTTILLAGRSGPFQYGDYRVYDMVDKGRLTGMFRAVHVQTNHLVMLQFLTGADTEDSRRWARLASRLQDRCAVVNTHLLRAFEVVDLTNFKFLVLEDLRGESLEQRLTGGSPVETGEACRLARQIALALAQLHLAGQAHSDVRPYNVWLDQNGGVKLLFDPHHDPGPIPWDQGDPSGQLLSQTDYMAPELSTNGKSPDALSDIYGLGCTLFHMLTGQPPFLGGDARQKMQRHASEPIQPLEPLGVPQTLAQLVAYSMAKNPEVRYQQASVVATQLESFIPAADLQAPSPAPPLTLAALESAIRLKQSRLAPPPSQPAAAPSFPAVEKPVVHTAAAASSASAPEPPSAPAPGPVIVADEKPLHQRGSKKAKTNAAATDPEAAQQEAKKKKIMQASIFGGAAALLLLAGVLFAIFGGRGKTDDDPKVAENKDNPGKQTTPTNKDNGNSQTDNGGKKDPPVTPTQTAKQTIVDDDGKMLWASPTEGEPVTLEYVPRNAQIYLFTRPAALLSSAEGRRVLTALGPRFVAMQKKWETESGVKLSEIETLTIALHDNQGRMPRPSFVVSLRNSLSLQDLLARWGNPTPNSEGEERIYQANGWSFLVLPGRGRRFVMASSTEIKDVATLKGAPPTLRRQMEMLRKASDDRRHFTALFAPNYLFSDGRELFSGDRQKVIDPLSWFLGDGLQAGMFSMHFEGSCFLEMRLLGTAEKDRYTLASDFRDRLRAIPGRIESYVDSLYAPPYWSKVARRYPLMIESLHEATRIGVAPDHAVINAAMHPAAAHNLLFGGEMLIASAPGGGGATTVAKPKGPQTLEEVLAAKIDLSFDQTSLEFSMRDLAAAVNEGIAGIPFTFKIRIIGPDLEKDGITRNQQVRNFNKENSSVADILTALVMKANPVTTVKEPSEMDQKLLWVIQPDPDAAGQRMVLVTTRNAAEQKGFALPAVFQPK